MFIEWMPLDEVCLLSFALRIVIKYQYRSICLDGDKFLGGSKYPFIIFFIKL